MPVFASEDFSYFLLEKPGAFFFLGSGNEKNDFMLHDSRYDFNDNLIEPATKFWFELAKDRLNWFKLIKLIFRIWVTYKMKMI